jgi:uncharacterized protein YjiS (DUF1127 family)
MTLILTDREDFSETAIHAVVRVAARSFADWRARRAKRIALQGLLEFDMHQLDDLGLSVETVRDALVQSR